MDKQKHALYTLIEVAKLSPAEAVSLTLGDLSLAGNNPTLKVWDEETGQRKTLTINKGARDALVAWLLERPDRPTTLFFPGEADEGLNPDDISALLKGFSPPPSAPIPESAEPLSDSLLAEEGLPAFKAKPPRPGSPKKAAPPPKSRPEPIVGATSPPPVARPETVSGGAKMTTPTPAVKDTPPANKAAKGFSFGPAAIIIAILFLLACVGLSAGGIFLARDQLAGLGSDSATPVAVESTEEIVQSTVEIVAMPDTPTPKPTNTPTLEAEAPPASPVETPTPEPTDTPAPEPTETPTEEPTETPTPEPTATPTPGPTNTPVSGGAEPPPPEPTATTGLKYSAPIPLAPEPDQHFITGNTIVLQWEPVDDLAGNEQYAVRVVYRHNAEVVYRGAQLKENHWTVPLEFYHDADGPDFLYTWYVYVEEVQPDGTGIPISPESPHRSFTWN